MKLRTKITFGMITLCVAALSICCSLMMFNSWKTQKEEAVIYTISELRGLLWKFDIQSIPLKSDASALAKDAILKYSFQKYASLSGENCEYVLQGEDGDIFNNSGFDVQKILNSNPLSSMKTANRNYITKIFQLDGRDYSVAGYQTIIYDYNYTISVVRDITDSMNRIRTLILYCIAINLLMIFTAAVVTVFFLRYALKPLETLQKNAQAIANGDYKKRVEIYPKDEIGALAQSFDLMADSIQLHIHEAEEKVQEQKMLLSALAHEMRTPVTAITGYAYALNSARLNQEQIQEAIGFIDSESRRLERLSTKLTQLISMEHKMPQLQPLSMHDLLQNVESILQSRANDKQIYLAVQFSEENSNIVLGDQDLLTVFLTNLFDNACKANAKNIIIRFHQNRLSIQDDGCGIPQDEIGQILQPFYQGDASRNREGFGLGLALCSKIAVLHHSELQIESQEGKGSIFCMKLYNSFTTS